jgi:Ca2+-binding EF-hand superfamily protein/serine/threonine protein kinase
MSQFESALQFYQSASKQARRSRKDHEITEEIPEDQPEETKQVLAESSSQAIADIKRKARAKIAEERLTDDHIEALLVKFKRFLTREKRERLLSGCEAADTGRLGVLPFVSVNRVLKTMGFRLLFDQLRSLLNYLQVYNEPRDRVYYPRLFTSVLNKLYKPDIGQPRPQITSLDAATTIKRLFKVVIEARARRAQAKVQAMEARSKPIDALQLATGLAQRVAGSSTSLLQVFQLIDTDGNGYIEMKELSTVFMDYGVKLTQRELEAVFRFMDRDNLGKLTYRDLSKLIEQYTPSQSADILSSISVSEADRAAAVRDLLAVMQKAVDASTKPIDEVFGLIGRRTQIDFETFSEIVGQMAPQIGVFERRQVFNFIDRDHSGSLSLDEFKKVILSNKTASGPADKGVLDRLEQAAELKAKTPVVGPRVEETKRVEQRTDRGPTVQRTDKGATDQQTEERKLKELLDKRAKEEAAKKQQADKKPKPFMSQFISKADPANPNATKPDLTKPDLKVQGGQTTAPSTTAKTTGATAQTPGTAAPLQATLKPAAPQPKVAVVKPTLAEEIEQKMKEAEDNAKKTPTELRQEEAKRQEEVKKAEQAKAEEAKKAEQLKLAEVKRKADEESKRPRSILRSGTDSAQTTNSARFRKTPGKKTLTIQEKAARTAKPTETAKLLKLKEKELSELIKQEFLMPIISAAEAHGESLMLARQLQQNHERRPVIRHWFAVEKAWEQASVNALPRSLCAMPQLGRVAVLDYSGALTQVDVTSGAPLYTLQLGTKPPSKHVPLLAAACDSRAGRLYTLDKQWRLNVWDVYQHSDCPAYSVRVINKPIGLDYVERAYTSRNRGLNPTLLCVGPQQEIVINCSAVDGCLYVLDPFSLTVSSRLLLPLSDYELAPSVIDALSTFSRLIALCEKVGITEKRAFELMDRNRDGQLTADEMLVAIRELKLPLTTEQVKGMVAAMDLDSSGSISLAEFHEAILLRSQVAAAKAEQEQPKVEVPTWVNDFNSNEYARQALYKLKLALEQKGYAAEQIFSVFDPDNTGVITKAEFTRTLNQLVGQLISTADIEVLVQCADPQRSNTVNYRELASLLRGKGTTPMQVAGVLSSSGLPKDSITYVLHKSLEQSVDLWKAFTTLDSLQIGSVSMSVLKQFLLTLPLGLTLADLNAICERDLSLTDHGEVDYVELLSSIEYSQLISAAHAKKLGPFLTPPTSERTAIIEDFCWLDDMEMFAYSTIRPLTSVVFLKQAKSPNLLLAKLVGHKFEYPPALMYVPVSNCLVTGERRPMKESLGAASAAAKCEVLLWNLQRDLLNRHSIAPPWVVRPYRRVVAHEHSVLDLSYLPQSQLIVSTGFDNKIKLWNPTGVPYSLTEPHALAVAPKKPGYYKTMPTEHTQTNQVMSLVATIDSPTLPCYKLIPCIAGSVEWLVCLGVGGSRATGVPATLIAWNIQRFSLKVPAFKHDVAVPKEIQTSCQSLMQSRLAKAVTSLKTALPNELEIWVSKARVHNTLVKDLRQLFVSGLLFERYDSMTEGFELASKLPFRKRFRTKGEVQAGWYRILSDFGLLQHCTFQKFERQLREVDNKLKTSLISGSRTFTHPAFEKLAQLVRRQGLDVAAAVTRHCGAKDLVHRNKLMDWLSSLSLDLSESDLTAMMDELDPYFTCNVEISRLSQYFAADQLAYKLKNLGRPTEVLDSIRAEIFPRHAMKFQYALVQADEDGTGLLTQAQFVQAVETAEISVSQDLLDIAFDVLARSTPEGRRVPIEFVIKQMLTTSAASQFSEVERVLTDIKCRLTYQYEPLEHLFKDSTGTLECIGVNEFVQKVQQLGSDFSPEVLRKVGAFLALPTAKSPAIYLSHYLKHIRRLPNSTKYIPSSLNSPELISEFASKQLLIDPKALQAAIETAADSHGLVTLPAFRKMLEDHFEVSSRSGVADLIIKSVFSSESLHFSQLFVKLQNLYGDSTKAEAGLNWQVREALEQAAKQQGISPSSIARKLFEKWEELDLKKTQFLNADDFINVIKFNLPLTPPDTLDKLRLRSNTVNYSEFAAEIFRGLQGVRLTDEMKQLADEANRRTLDEAFLLLNASLRSSGVSLQRAFAIFDRNLDSIISCDDFAQALRLLDLRLSSEQLISLTSTFQRDGLLNYKQFIQAVGTHSASKPSIDLSHWTLCAQRLLPTVLDRMKEAVEMFMVKLLGRDPENDFISCQMFQEVLQELKMFTVEEVEVLADFAIEGSRSASKGLLPSQQPMQLYSYSKRNELVNYRHFAEAVHKLVPSKPEPSLEKTIPRSAVTTVSRPELQTPKKSETRLEQLEDELMVFLANYLKTQKMSVQRLFFEADTDDSGTINEVEFKEFMRKVGMTLTIEEVRHLIKAIDENQDSQISYVEFKAKLKQHGYVEPAEQDMYAHSWVDTTVMHLLHRFNLQKLGGYPDYRTMFERFDFNCDGKLLQSELLQALHTIAPEGAERLLNILVVETKGNLEVTTLDQAMSRMEREHLKPKAPVMPVAAVVEVIKADNALSVFESTLERLHEQAGAVLKTHVLRRVKRGLELLSYQYTLPQVLSLLDDFGTKLREFLSALNSIAHSRIMHDANQLLIDPDSNVQSNNIPPSQTAGPPLPRLQSAQFKVLWDSAEPTNLAMKVAEGFTLPDQEPLVIEVYNPEGLRHVSLDGATLEHHLNHRLRVQALLQPRLRHMTKCVGTYERRVGVEPSEKELYLMYELPPGLSLKEMLQLNGGLLKIPLLYQSKASVYVWKYWGRQVLELLFTLQSNSAVLRTLNSSNIHLAEGGLRLALSSLRGVGTIDPNGVITSAPDLSVSLSYKEDFYNDPYIAPEYLLDREQTSSVDVWNFGVLMHELLFGLPPPSFLGFYRQWAEGKAVPREPSSEKPAPRPCPNLFIDLYSTIRLGDAGAVSVPYSLKNVIDSVTVGSYSGITEGQDRSSLSAKAADARSLASLQKSYESLLNTELLSQTHKSDIGLILDLVAMCLQINPSHRPTVRGLLMSPLFQLDDFQQRHAEHFSKRLLDYKSPQIMITQAVTQPLLQLSDHVQAGDLAPQEVVRIIQHLQDNVCSSASAHFASHGLGDMVVIGKADREAVLTLSDTAERESQAVEALKSPVAPLVRRMVEDGVLDMLVYIALKHLGRGESQVVRQLVELLSNLIFELYSYASPWSAYVEVVLEALLKLFIGEPLHLASCARAARGRLPGSAYVQRQSHWSPELYHIVGPLYKDTISDNGLGQHYYPVIRDFITRVRTARTLGAAAVTSRDADYYSELISLAENMVLLKNLATGKAAKSTALRHIRSMLQTRNEQKISAALDFRLPQHLIHLLHDDDSQVRLEAISVLREISSGCLPAASALMTMAVKKHRQFSIANFFSAAKAETHLTTKDFVRRADISADRLPATLVEMAKCFESPVYIVPLVHLLKLKSEPYDNKEGIVRVLTCILRGSEQMLQAAQTPATDLISTLCKSLVIASRNSDHSSSRVLAPLLKESLLDILDLARPSLIKAFEITPGAKALLRDQQIELRRPATMQTLLDGVPETVTVDFNPAELAVELQRWLEHVYRQQGSSHPVAYSAVQRVVETMRHAIDLNWTAAESQTHTQAKDRVARALEVLDWLVANGFDYLWFREPHHLGWLMNRIGDASKKPTGGYLVYPLHQELLVVQRILNRLLERPLLSSMMEALDFGRFLATLFELQFGHLSQVLERNTESLHLLPVYAAQSDLRLTGFENLLKHPSAEIKRQFVESEFLEMFVVKYLPDCRVLDARFYKLTFEFLTFRECAPLRGEAIAMMESLLRRRADNQLLFDDLLLHMRRQNAVAFELQSLKGAAVAQTTALQVLDLCVSCGDPQLDYMLLQEEAQVRLGEVLRSKASWQLEFPGLSRYLQQFK